MKKTMFLVFFVFFLAAALVVFSGPSVNFLSKGQADSLYCWVEGGNCNLSGGGGAGSNITIVGDVKWSIDNVWVINVSNSLTINQTTLNATIDNRDNVGASYNGSTDTYVNTTGDQMTGDLNMSLDVKIQWSDGAYITQTSGGDMVFEISII